MVVNVTLATSATDASITHVCWSAGSASPDASIAWYGRFESGDIYAVTPAWMIEALRKKHRPSAANDVEFAWVDSSSDAAAPAAAAAAPVDDGDSGEDTDDGSASAASSAPAAAPAIAVAPAGAVAARAAPRHLDFHYKPKFLIASKAASLFDLLLPVFFDRSAFIYSTTHTKGPELYIDRITELDPVHGLGGCLTSTELCPRLSELAVRTAAYCDVDHFDYIALQYYSDKDDSSMPPHADTENPVECAIAGISLGDERVLVMSPPNVVSSSSKRRRIQIRQTLATGSLYVIPGAMNSPFDVRGGWTHSIAQKQQSGDGHRGRISLTFRCRSGDKLGALFRHDSVDSDNSYNVAFARLSVHADPGSAAHQSDAPPRFAVSLVPSIVSEKWADKVRLRAAVFELDAKKNKQERAAQRAVHIATVKAQTVSDPHSNVFVFSAWLYENGECGNDDGEENNGSAPLLALLRATDVDMSSSGGVLLTIRREFNKASESCGLVGQTRFHLFEAVAAHALVDEGVVCKPVERLHCWCDCHKSKFQKDAKPCKHASKLQERGAAMMGRAHLRVKWNDGN
jgi:hypothetical protein